MKKMIHSWNQFFFEAQSWSQLLVMRVVMGLTLLYMYITRFFDPQLLGEKGMISRELAPMMLPEPYRLPWVFHFWPDSFNFVLQLVLIAMMVVFIIGRLPRWGVFILWFLHYAFIQRNYAICFGADIISNLFLFNFIFIQPRPIEKFLSDEKLDWLSTVGVRLIQIQLCVIYAYTGFEKMKGSTWWDGTALWSVMANPQLATFDFTFLRHIPWSIPIANYVTVLFETYFPLLIFIPQARIATLIFGVLFHFGIGAFMGLGPFSAIMLSPYLLFISGSQYKTLVHGLMNFSLRKLSSKLN